VLEPVTGKTFLKQELLLNFRILKLLAGQTSFGM